MRYYAEAIQQADTSLSKHFRTGSGSNYRQFNDKINAMFKCHFCPVIFIYQSRGSTLDKAAAYNSNTVIGVRIFSCFFYMILMSFVKRIIFCDNSCDIHCI